MYSGPAYPCCCLKCFLQVLLALDRRFVSLLADAFHLRAVAHTLHDETLDVRLVAVPLLGQLSGLNPAVAMPLLRRTLLSLQKELCTTDGGGPFATSSRRRKEEAAQMLQVAPPTIIIAVGANVFLLYLCARCSNDIFHSSSDCTAHNFCRRC